MHIIFDGPVRLELEQKHVVLELDRVLLPDHSDFTTAYCVLENIPFQELSIIEKLKDWHGELMLAYRARDWDQCLSGLARLKGQWGGQIDSFYDVIYERVKAYKEAEPEPDWDGVVKM